MDAPTLTPGLAAAALWTGLHALMFVVLSFVVIRQRVARKVSLGDGGEDDVRRAVRVHGNFAEYAPMTLLMLVLAALIGTPAWVVHIFGALFFAGRLAHAAQILGGGELGPGRSLGMLSTFACLILLGLGLIGHALGAL